MGILVHGGPHALSLVGAQCGPDRYTRVVDEVTLVLSCHGDTRSYVTCSHIWTIYCVFQGNVAHTSFIQAIIISSRINPIPLECSATRPHQAFRCVQAISAIVCNG